jgi:hypothetical protein
MSMHEHVYGCFNVHVHLFMDLHVSNYYVCLKTIAVKMIYYFVLHFHKNMECIIKSERKRDIYGPYG